VQQLAQGTIRTVFAARRAEDVAAELNHLPAEITHVLVLKQGCTIRNETTLWEAMRLFEMHGDVALASGRVLDETGTVVAACKPILPNAIWVGMKRDDPGAFAMALKTQSALTVPDSFFFCRRDLLRDAATSPGPASWAERLTTLAQARRLRIAYSPLIEGVLVPQSDHQMRSESQAVLQHAVA
jgi:hypothetical protein